MNSVRVGLQRFKHQRIHPFISAQVLQEQCNVVVLQLAVMLETCVVDEVRAADESNHAFIVAFVELHGCNQRESAVGAPNRANTLLRRRSEVLPPSLMPHRRIEDRAAGHVFVNRLPLVADAIEVRRLYTTAAARHHCGSPIATWESTWAIASTSAATYSSSTIV